MDNKILKISIYNHFASLYSLIVFVAILTVLLVKFDFNKGVLIAYVISILLDAIPAIYLHLSYWSKNKDEKYKLAKNKLIRIKDDNETIYLTEEISKIITFQPPSLYKGSNFHLLSIESYHYAVVRLKTGEDLILTCLLSPSIDKLLKQMQGVVFERRKKLFCSI